MALLVDTSVFITLERRREPLSSLFRSVADEPLMVASITASELLVGVRRANSTTRRHEREHIIETILSALTVLPFDLRATRIHATLTADLLASGQIVGAHDLIIGATALGAGSAVLTVNLRDLRRIEGLEARQPVW